MSIFKELKEIDELVMPVIEERVKMESVTRDTMRLMNQIELEAGKCFGDILPKLEELIFAAIDGKQRHILSLLNSEMAQILEGEAFLHKKKILGDLI